MRKLYQIKADEYKSDDGFVMRREDGLTPNGNQIGQRWVLRNSYGHWIDIDQYRFDLAGRHDFQLIDGPIA